jgi:hypothetical protein
MKTKAGCFSLDGLLVINPNDMVIDLDFCVRDGNDILFCFSKKI